MTQQHKNSALALKSAFDGTNKPPERLAKRIAGAGLCSRREAEKWITQGRVTVNGKTHTSPALTVSEADSVSVDGKKLAAASLPRLWRYYKPRGLIVSHSDEKNRKTIFDALPPTMPRVISVGRLDLDSEGLILLTTSGELARHLELPSTGWSRKYRARVRGRVNPESLTALERGITINGTRYREIKASIERQMPSNAWLQIALREGKNREIRVIMEHLGYQVSRLIRVSFGPFTLKGLESGDCAEIRSSVLRDQLGLK